MYEVADDLQGLPQKDYTMWNFYTAILAFIIFASGALIKFIEYRKELGKI